MPLRSRVSSFEHSTEIQVTSPKVSDRRPGGGRRPPPWHQLAGKFITFLAVATMALGFFEFQKFPPGATLQPQPPQRPSVASCRDPRRRRCRSATNCVRCQSDTHIPSFGFLGVTGSRVQTDRSRPSPIGPVGHQGGRRRGGRAAVGPDAHGHPAVRMPSESAETETRCLENSASDWV